MATWSRRDWVSVFVVPVAAVLVGGIFIHVLTRPDPAYSVESVWKWSFVEAVFRLLPTLVAMSFVYHLTVLPFVRSRTRRSAVFLTAFAGPTLAIGLLVVGLMACPLAMLDAMARGWGNMVDAFRYHGGSLRQMEELLLW